FDQGKETEVRGLNLISAFLHGKASSMRLSLTLRIAWHECIQLLRSLVLIIPLSLVLFVCSLAPQIHAQNKRILYAIPGKDGTFSQAVIQAAGVSAKVAEDEVPQTFFEKVQYIGKHLSDSGRGTVTWPRHHRVTGQMILISRELKGYASQGVILLAGLLLCDLARMCYFLYHHHRMDATLLRPIQEMTEMAAHISANNLSDRISVAGTKSELQDLASVINTMLDRLEVSYNSQKQFVSDASHELRTPISVIQGYADMLSRWGKEDPSILQEGLEAIGQETRSMKDLVEDLLFLARHDKKTLLMEMSTFDPAQLLQEIRKEAEMVNPGNVFVLSPCESCDLTADRNMIKQVMRILLDNAVKYSSEGGRITMGVRAMGNMCELSMEDQGSGISKEDLPRIFDRFYRSDAARKRESGGHGLGLSIARIIVMAHGGKIRVRSKLGEGTSFFVVLPLEQIASGEISVEEQPEKPKRLRRYRLHRERRNSETD
ncbi:MAG: HAMP domain-containing protein, partial [Clostridia bacterium]|nr:HAMP domain-containing protein [Clostridia bacterium]